VAPVIFTAIGHRVSKVVYVSLSRREQLTHGWHSVGDVEAKAALECHLEAEGVVLVAGRVVWHDVGATRQSSAWRWR
jgi:hypothetical protein